MTASVTDIIPKQQLLTLISTFDQQEALFREPVNSQYILSSSGNGVSF